MLIVLNIRNLRLDFQRVFLSISFCKKFLDKNLKFNQYKRGIKVLCRINVFIELFLRSARLMATFFNIISNCQSIIHKSCFNFRSSLHFSSVHTIYILCSEYLHNYMAAWSYSLRLNRDCNWLLGEVVLKDIKIGLFLKTCVLLDD